MIPLMRILLGLSEGVLLGGGDFAKLPQDGWIA